MDERLLRFLAHARGQGVDFATLRAILLARGWKERQVDEGLERELGMAVPPPREAGSSRDTFLHLLAFTALYTWVIALIVLGFTYVNLALPDAAWAHGTYYLDSARSSIRWSLAALIVGYPLFFFLWRSLLRGFAEHPEKRTSGARRWLTYLSLFVGAMTILGDVITLLYYFFEGELTQRFLLKVLLLFLVTGSVILYLALTLRATPEERA